MKSFFITAFLWFPISAYRGFVFSKLWLWFVVPVFNVRTISVAQATGVCIAVVFASYPSMPHHHSKWDNGVLRKLTDTELAVDSCLFWLVWCSMVWGGGALWHFLWGMP